MLKKLHISLIFSNLAVKIKTTKITAMHNVGSPESGSAAYSFVVNAISACSGTFLYMYGIWLNPQQSIVYIKYNNARFSLRK